MCVHWETWSFAQADTADGATGFPDSPVHRAHPVQREKNAHFQGGRRGGRHLLEHTESNLHTALLGLC